MNVHKQTISDTKIKLTINVDRDQIDQAKARAIKKLSKSIKVAGFRPGKTPPAVVEQNVDANQLQTEVLQDVIQEQYQQAAIQEDLRVLSAPKIEVSKFVPFTELEFTAEVETMPVVKLGDYKKIKKSAPKIKVTDKDVADVLENLRQRSAEKKPTDAAAKAGDEVIVDFDGFDSKDKAVAGASGKDYPLTLGSNTFIPGFEDGLVGVKAGDDKELKLAFPKDYHSKPLAGTKITFKVHVKKVNQVILPDVNDEFAVKISPFKTLKELKVDIETQLTEQKATEAANKLKDEIVEEIVKKSKFALPEVLVNDQLQMLEQDFAQNLTYRGITKPEYIQQQGHKDEEEWKTKELLPQAERRVSVGIILANISEKESIAVSDQEVDERVKVYKQQYQQQADQFDTPEMRREVASRLLTEKTVDFLYQNAVK